MTCAYFLKLGNLCYIVKAISFWAFLKIFCFKELPQRDFSLEASYPAYHSDSILFIVAGVAPGNFGRGLILPKRGLKYGFQGTINTKNRRKSRLFFTSRQGVACSDGRAIASLALPWRHPCIAVRNYRCQTKIIREKSQDKKNSKYSWTSISRLLVRSTSSYLEHYLISFGFGMVYVQKIPPDKSKSG